MPRKAKELGALAVSRLTKPGRWSVGGVDGLALQVTATGARSWVLRLLVAGRRREMGLGSFPSVTLAGAREMARMHRAVVNGGADPIAQRHKAVSAAAAERSAQRTFAQCCGAYIEAHEKGWRSPKHAQQWANTLATYAEPVMGRLLVRDIATVHVLQAVEPIWATKTETASRLRNRIELVLDWAATRGYREGLNPARWRGHLDKTLPKPSKVAAVEHHPALSLADVPAFMVKLRAAEGMSAKALEFAILTAARSGEVRGATWGEIDMQAATWSIAGTRMKSGKPHRVALSPAAIKLLNTLPQGEAGDLVFPGAKKGQPLSDMSLTAVMRRMGANAVPHGFRSSFADWGRTTGRAEELIELALAHVVGTKTRRAYARDDALEQRRPIMAAWAAFLVEKPAAKGATVVTIKQVTR